jgi:hypothetical protein
MKIIVYKIASEGRFFSNGVTFAENYEEQSPMYTNRTNAKRKIRDITESIERDIDRCKDTTEPFTLSCLPLWRQDLENWKKADVIEYELVRRE